MGVAAYREALGHAAKYFDYLIMRAMAMFPVRSPEGKVKAVNYLLPHIQRVPSAIIRQGLADDIAQKLGIDSAVLRRELKTAATRRSTAQIQSAPDAHVTPAERLLVRAASSTTAEEAEMRRTALDVVSSEYLHSGLTTETLLETLLQNRDNGHDPLQLPFSDSDRQLFMRIVMRGDEPLSPDLLEGALEALRHRRWLIQRERDIKQGIAEAERAKDHARLIRLKQEKLELDRKLAAGQN
jgi:DNA primase